MSLCRRSKYDSMVAQVAEHERLDADLAAVLVRQLESIETHLTRVQYPQLKALDLVPVIPGIDPGAETYTWRLLDLVGYAKVIANHGEDLPRGDLSISENYRPIRSIGAQYGWTTQELRRIALAARNGSSVALDQERANAARYLIERKLDAMIALGEPNVAGLTGFVNDPNVTLVTPTYGGWGTATAAQILSDLQQLEAQVMNQSKETAAADTLLLPIDKYLRVAQLPLGANNDFTVMTFFKANAVSIKNIEPWYLLSTANAAGNGARAVAYKRDPMVVGAIVPLLFEAQPPQPRALAYDVPCEARCGGAVVRTPLGVAYMDGI